MKKIILLLSLFFAFASAAFAQVTVYPETTVGKIKCMNAVNNGPRIPKQDQTYFDCTTYYVAANVGYSRNHDASGCYPLGGEHIVDITQIFPDFSKDPEDPASYDFTLTDRYVKFIQEMGTEVFYRLGQTIEHNPKKYGIWVPKDFNKWASIAEHIIRHYNNGWADGYHWGIKYWEIWNEPNLDWYDERWKTDPRCWAGSPEQFFDFYEVSSKYLKKMHPELKIGGPAFAGSPIQQPEVPKWYEIFVEEMAKRKAPLDFFSWHLYNTNVEKFAKQTRDVRNILDKHGFTATESILNEWNFVKNWNEHFAYTTREIGTIKGAAFTCAVMQACQDAPLDMLMYYDCQPSTNFNGIFDQRTNTPMAGYWALYAWGQLKKLGTQVKAECEDPEIRVTAAVGPNGKLGILVGRYTADNNVTDRKKIQVRLEGKLFDENVRCHITDLFTLYTEYPVALQKDGTLSLNLDPTSFVFIEF